MRTYINIDLVLLEGVHRAIRASPDAGLAGEVPTGLSRGPLMQPSDSEIVCRKLEERSSVYRYLSGRPVFDNALLTAYKALEGESTTEG